MFSKANMMSVRTHFLRLKKRIIRPCQCDLCKRSKRYYQNTKNLPSKEKNWMRSFYDAVLDEESEREMEAFAKSERFTKSSDKRSRSFSAVASARVKTGAPNNQTE